MKKRNKLVNIVNIAIGILVCMCLYFVRQAITIEMTACIRLTDKETAIFGILTITLGIVLISNLIINIISIFKNRHNKKSMICSIITTLIMIIAITLVITLKEYKYGYSIIITSLIGIIALITDKTENDSKNHIVLIILELINILLLIAIITGMIIVKKDYKVYFANNNTNILESLLEISNGNTTRPISICKNGKWGYIDNNGNTIIDCIYDDCADFAEITQYNQKYYVAPVVSGNEMKIITSDNKVLASCIIDQNKNSFNIKIAKMDIFGKLDSDKDRNKNMENVKIKNSFGDIPELYEGLNDKTYRYDGISYSDKIESKYGTKLTYEIYDYEQDETIILKYDSQSNKVIFNDKELNINGKLNILIEDNEKYLEEDLIVYINGYIPFKNEEENIVGWIDTNGEIHRLRGKGVEILDFIEDKYIVVSLNSDDEEQKRICFIDNQAKIVSNMYRELAILDYSDNSGFKGYIAKKENGKNVFLDEELREITEEYDVIEYSRVVEDGITVAANFSENNESLNFSVINLKTGKIIAKELNCANKAKQKKYENINKELICKVGNEFLEF